MGSLRGLFTNLNPAQNSLVKRWKRGAYRSSQRDTEAPIRDLRGPVVGTIATPQTFLSAAEIDGLVDDYLAGATVAELAAKYTVHRATVSKHLTREGVTRRTPGLHGWDAAEAVRLFREGESLRGISLSLGVGRALVRRTLALRNEIAALAAS